MVGICYFENCENHRTGGTSPHSFVPFDSGLSPSDIWTEESVLPDLAVKNSKQKQDQNKMSPNAGNTTKIL